MTTTLLLAGALAVQPGTAEAIPTEPQQSTPQIERSGDHHRGQAQDIVVTGVRRNREDVLGGITVLSAETLAREVRATIGETLASQPGVSATSFGPNASRPIIRGLGGERIRVLTDGIGSLDVSTSSADHAVAINPLTAERIEVLRGPAALLFGSSAIGGVVNVIDSRIPRSEPERPFHLDAIGTLGSAAEERALNVTLDVPLVSKLVLHGDASWLKTDDLEIGGHVLSRPLREQASASGDPGISALADLGGVLPNSAAKSSELAGGIAWVDKALNVGFAVSRLDNLYGVPVRYALQPGGGAEQVRLDVKQRRYDARAEIPLEGGFLDQLRLRGGVVDYRHDELEETGEIGTSFFSEGAEGRLEIVQRVQNGWGGAFGAQHLQRSARIRGEEKYLPDTRLRQTGIFALQNYAAGRWRAEVGGRVEFSRATAEIDEVLGTPDYRRSFTAYSASLGSSRDIGAGIRAGLNLSYTERAPSPDELYANGPHAGTQAFEIGNPDFDKERSVGLEAVLKRGGGLFTFGLNIYHTRFADFIYLAPSGSIEDDLPVYEYRQGKSRFTGFELEARADAGRFGGVEWAVEGVADYVRARVAGFGPAPQIPPLRLLGAVEGRRGLLDGRLEVEHSFAQRRNAPAEPETSGFTLVNASLSWRPLADKPELTLSLAANNILDVNARRHTSLLKDYAPLPGRDFRLTARVGF
jgi:iron complex outermembrane receptor protein